MTLRLAYFFSVSLLFNFDSCGSSIAVAAEISASKFRGFYLGMNSIEFAQAIARIDVDYVLQFYYVKEGDRSRLFAQIWEKGNYSLFWDWPCGFDNRKLACVSVKWVGTRDDVNRLGMQHPNQFKFSEDDRGAEYSLILNLSDPPPFSVEKLELFPKFLGANGVTISDFGQSLVRNHQFVGDKLFAGRDKGIKCDCFVGLLKTGERVSLKRTGAKRTAANDDWMLDIDFPDESFRHKFVSSSRPLDER